MTKKPSNYGRKEMNSDKALVSGDYEPKMGRRLGRKKSMSAHSKERK